MSTSAISWILNELLNITGVRPAAKMTEGMKHNQRTALMQCHGFRKFFDTTCTIAGMNPVYIEFCMGHSLGLKGRYAKPSVNDLLEGNDKNIGYVGVIDALTINNENRLQIKLEKEQSKQDAIADMQLQQNALKEMMIKLVNTLAEAQDQNTVNALSRSLAQSKILVPKNNNNKNQSKIITDDDDNKG